MRGRNITHSMEFNGQRRDDCVLMCLSSDRKEYWSIDVPSALWILERVAAGDVDARIARDELQRAAAASATWLRLTTPRHADATRMLSAGGTKNTGYSRILLRTPTCSTTERSTPCVVNVHPSHRRPRF